MKFDPLTFGYEWETLILKPNMMLVDKADVEWFSRELRRRLSWSRTGLDIIRRTHAKILEIKSGIMKSHDELIERTDVQFEEVNRICSEKEWIFFPVGCHPAFEGAVGFHVHIGSFYKHRAATRLANTLSKYAPALAALMANSPIWGPLETSGYKSRRVLNAADWCSTITYVMDPDFAQALWGHDISVTLGIKPTIEVRIGDSPFSKDLLNEYTVLVTALISSIPESELMTKSEYTESIENRWRAAKDGLQATFSWGGKPKEVKEIIYELLERANPGFRKLGAKPLELIPLMLEKRLTQADLQIMLYHTNPDTHSMAKDLANLIKDRDCFRKYLEADATAECEPLRDIEDEILSVIGKETPYWNIYDSFRFPYAWLDNLLARLEEEGKIRSEKTPEKGALYTRSAGFFELSN